MCEGPLPNQRGPLLFGRVNRIAFSIGVDGAKACDTIADEVDKPLGYHSPPGIAARPDQSSIVPDASFQFGLTSTGPSHFAQLMRGGNQESIRSPS